MRFAVLADVHGNLPALQAVLEEISRSPVDGYIIAGDYVACPHANETIAMLRSLRGWMILGNGDIKVTQFDAGLGPEAWRTHKQFGLLRWIYRNLDQDSLNFLRSLPEQAVVGPPALDSIRVVHGSPRTAFKGLHPTDPHGLEQALALSPEPVLVCAHTHVPWALRKNGTLILNPGAVCGPLNGDWRAQYAYLTWEGNRWQVEHHAVPYDLQRLRSAFVESGLLKEGGGLAKAFMLSNETGLDIGKYFLEYAYRLADEAGHDHCTVVPDAIWDYATNHFNWEDYSNDRS